MSIDQLYAAYKECSGVCTDTRKVQENNLFIALKGPNFNANDFALTAIKDGCRYAIVDEDRPEFHSHQQILIVEDALKALQSLALHHRKKLRIPIIGLTGSNGKTTTKELLRAVLSEQYRCYSTLGNFNNHIGVPLSLLEIEMRHEIAVIEMGANHRKEIRDLSAITEPDYGLITNIGLAHLEGFGGEEGVFQGKKELFDFLIENGGTLFLNMDDAKVVKAADDYSKTVTYGSAESAIYRGHVIPGNELLSIEWWRPSQPQDRYQISTNISGSYNFSNIMAAIAIGRYFGVSAQKIKQGLERYVPSNQRSQIERTVKKNTVIVDCYNANPSSMQAAIANLESIAHDQKTVILGDMLELGDTTRAEHAHVLQQLRTAGIDTVMLIGPEFSSLDDLEGVQHFQTTEAAAAALSQRALSGNLILLKGSRKMKLEALLEFL